MNEAAPVRTAVADAPPVDVAAQRLYDAEVALHTAHTSHVDTWIAAAAERLHQAVEDYLAAVAAA